MPGNEFGMLAIRLRFLCLCLCPLPFLFPLLPLRFPPPSASPVNDGLRGVGAGISDEPPQGPIVGVVGHAFGLVQECLGLGRLTGASADLGGEQQQADESRRAGLAATDRDRLVQGGRGAGPVARLILIVRQGDQRVDLARGIVGMTPRLNGPAAHSDRGPGLSRIRTNRRQQGEVFGLACGITERLVGPGGFLQRFDGGVEPVQIGERLAQRPGRRRPIDAASLRLERAPRIVGALGRQTRLAGRPRREA